MVGHIILLLLPVLAVTDPVLRFPSPPIPQSLTDNVGSVNIDGYTGQNVEVLEGFAVRRGDGSPVVVHVEDGEGDPLPIIFQEESVQQESADFAGRAIHSPRIVHQYNRNKGFSPRPNRRKEMNLRQITAAIDKAVGDTLSELGDSMLQFVVEETQKAIRDVANQAKEVEAKSANAIKANETVEEVRSSNNFDQTTIENDKFIRVSSNLPVLENLDGITTAVTTTSPASDQEEKITTTTNPDLFDTDTTAVPVSEEIPTTMAERTDRKIDSSAVKFNNHFHDDAAYELDYLDYAYYATRDYEQMETHDDYECEHLNICKLNETQYPDNEIREAIRKANELTRVLLQSLASMPEEKEELLARGRSSGLGIAFRSGFAADYEAEEEDLQEEETPAVHEENACRVKKQRIYPRWAKNMKGTQTFIINRPKGEESYVQVVDVVECQDDQESCLPGTGFNSRCHQEYTEHKLLALDMDKGEIVIDRFSFPSCCSCYVDKSLFID